MSISVMEFFPRKVETNKRAHALSRILQRSDEKITKQHSSQNILWSYKTLSCHHVVFSLSVLFWFPAGHTFTHTDIGLRGTGTICAIQRLSALSEEHSVVNIWWLKIHTKSDNRKTLLKWLLLPEYMRTDRKDSRWEHPAHRL